MTDNRRPPWARSAADRWARERAMERRAGYARLTHAQLDTDAGAIAARPTASPSERLAELRAWQELRMTLGRVTMPWWPETLARLRSPGSGGPGAP